MRKSERGYALTDALIAASIAAAVIVASAKALGVSIRIAHVASERQQLIAEAQIIKTRLEAGLRDEALLYEIDGWRISDAIDSAEGNNQASRPAYRTRRIRINHEAHTDFAFEYLIVASAGA